MLFVPQAAQDIERYYHGTYVKFQETGDRLFYIDHVSKHKVSGMCDDETPFDLYLSDEFPYEVDYVLPNKSFFQHGDHAYMLERRPMKQYKRGLCGENVSLFRHRGGNEFTNWPISFEVLKAFVAKQNFPTLKEAFLNEGKRLSIAVTPRILYVPKGGRLFIDRTQVALIRAGKNSVRNIELILQVFRQESEALLGDDKSFKVV